MENQFGSAVSKILQQKHKGHPKKHHRYKETIVIFVSVVHIVQLLLSFGVLCIFNSLPVRLRLVIPNIECKM